MTETSFMLAGLSSRKNWYGLRGYFSFTNEGLSVVISAKREIRKKSHLAVEYQAGFLFDVDPVELGAAMVLASVCNSDVTFTWMGKADSTGEPWVLRSYWYYPPPPPLPVQGLEDLKQKINAGEADAESGNELLDKLWRRLVSKPRYALTLGQVMPEKGQNPISLNFVMRSACQAGVLSVCRKAALNQEDLYLIGGLRVMTKKGDVFLAAGSSKLLKLTSEERAGLRYGIQRAIESEYGVSIRVGHVAYYVPNSNGQPFWTTGIRISVLGRIIPFFSAKEAAKLLAVL